MSDFLKGHVEKLACVCALSVAQPFLATCTAGVNSLAWCRTRLLGLAWPSLRQQPLSWPCALLQKPTEETLCLGFTVHFQPFLTCCSPMSTEADRHDC